MNNVPQSLILLPGLSFHEAPPAYGMIALHPQSSFFAALRMHRDHAMVLAKLGADSHPPQNEGTEKEPKYEAHTFYDQFALMSGWCTYLHQLPEDFGSDDTFRGIDDFITLLSLTAEDRLKRSSDVTIDLDDDGGYGRPVLIDFQQWFTNVSVGGYFKGTIESFWDAIQNLAIDTEMDKLVISPPHMLPVTRRGPVVQYADVSGKVKFYFTADVEHTDGVLETKMLDISSFVTAFEDVALSPR